jgi:hypothetical protein
MFDLNGHFYAVLPYGEQTPRIGRCIIFSTLGTNVAPSDSARWITLCAAGGGQLRGIEYWYSLGLSAFKPIIDF